MLRKYILILLLAVTALVLPQTARAQAEVQIGTLEINLWPEYDDPGMLVIYKGTLLPESLPADLTFRIPKASGGPFKVAVSGETDKNLYETVFTVQTGSEWIEVTFHVASNQFQLEYYDPGLVKQGAKRSYQYIWPGDYAVTTATIIVQQPVDSSKMQIKPENVASFNGVDELLYYGLQAGTWKKDQTFELSLSYEKSTDALTFEKQQVHPADPLPQSMWSRGLPWALGVLALLLIGGGVFIYWRSGLPQAGDKKRRRRKPTTPAGSGETPEEDSGVYCHTCGRRAGAGDVFCRSCGTKLRV